MHYQPLLLAALAFTAQAARPRVSNVNNDDDSAPATGGTDDAVTAADVAATSATAAPATAASSSMTTTTRRTTTSTGIPTLSILLGDTPASAAFSASIIDANACDTTLAIKCGGTACTVSGLPLPEITLTQNPTNRLFVSTTMTAGAEATFSEDCALTGSPLTQAVCSGSISVSGGTINTGGMYTTTLTGNELNVQPVTVTAGASKLSSATGSCTTSPGAAAPTAGSVVYKVMVPIVAGAAAVML